jgi:chaperonin GroEL (HSP60 family)
MYVLQILVELADLQDQEVGDGTTSVVILAAELLKRANDLVRAKIHPTSIIAGYRLAMREVSSSDIEVLTAAEGSHAMDHTHVLQCMPATWCAQRFTPPA